MFQSYRPIKSFPKLKRCEWHETILNWWAPCFAEIATRILFLEEKWLPFCRVACRRLRLVSSIRYWELIVTRPFPSVLIAYLSWTDHQTPAPTELTNYLKSFPDIVNCLHLIAVEHSPFKARLNTTGTRYNGLIRSMIKTGSQPDQVTSLINPCFYHIRFVSRMVGHILWNFRIAVLLIYHWYLCLVIACRKYTAKY